ncbi:MAG: STAS domain-containing protein [Actinomycetota bacterium]|nr:STAS domain-containing protein [Actinomycetota bacterium]
MPVVWPSGFTCLATLNGAQATVEISGELDMSTAPELSRSLSEVLDRHPREVTVDLGRLAFIDSTGLTLLVRTSNSLKQHDGALRLTRPTPPVRRVLEIVGLDGLLVA